MERECLRQPTTTRRRDDSNLSVRDPRAAGGYAAGMQGRGDLERREGVRRKIGPEAFRSAEAPIRHWRPIDLATEVILNRPSDHPSRGRIVRTCDGGPIFHASEAGAAALRPDRPALRTGMPKSRSSCRSLSMLVLGSWFLVVGSLSEARINLERPAAYYAAVCVHSSTPHSPS